MTTRKSRTRQSGESEADSGPSAEGDSGRPGPESSAASAPPERARQETAGGDEPNVAGRVLIVEDNSPLRIALHMYFEIRGYEVESVGNYRSAIEAAAEFVPDFVICDWQIDGVRSGADVARTLQEEFCSAIIFVTGASVDDLREETADLSVVHYFEKPVGPAVLEAAIRSSQ